MLESHIVGKLMNILPFHHKESPTPIAQVGAAYFATASIRFPASATAQSACIALLCRENSQSPEVLGKALIQDRSRLEKLAATANNAHIHHRVRGVRRIEEKNVFQIARDEFDLAQMMMVLNDAEIQDVLTTMYSQRNETVHDAERTGQEHPDAVKKAERAYNQQVRQLIERVNEKRQ